MSIQDGSVVTLHFKMTVDDEVAQDTRQSEPFTYVQGREQLFPTLEAGLEGLKAGDTKTIELSADQAFGQRDPSAVQDVPKSGFPDQDAVAVGVEVRGNVQGRQFRAIITEVREDTVTLDLNHPLAGKDLTFDVEVITVK